MAVIAAKAGMTAMREFHHGWRRGTA